MNIDWLPSQVGTWCDEDGPEPPRSHTPLLDAALEYARHGWSVFPCRGKQPYTTDGFKSASSDPRIVEAWWSRWADANVGWPVKVGWFALDVDPRHDGDKSLRELQREHGPLPMTLRAVTGSGGEHWIFKIPAGVEIRQLAGFKPGLDTRVGGRGYLLVAPSIHPDTGKPYRWLATVEPVDPPTWLLELVKAPSAPPPRAAYVPPTASHEMDKRRRYALAALKGCADDVRACGKGERNNALNKAWFRMATFKDVIGEQEAREALLDAALTVGLSDTEARKVLR